MSTTDHAVAPPQDIPKVAELGTTSAPLKSAAFFLGAYCKEYNGTALLLLLSTGLPLCVSR